jgi:hypothetical protein
VPLREAFEQVAAQAAELSAKLARTNIRAMRSVLEIMVLSSSSLRLLLAFVYLARTFLFGATRESSFGLLVSVSVSPGS